MVMQNNTTKKHLNKTNMKKAAVEWFFNELQRMQYFIGNDMLEAFKQAKEMEKQQIKDAWKDGYGGDTHDENDYFDKNYGK